MLEDLDITQFIYQKAEEFKIDKVSVISLKEIIYQCKKNNMLNYVSKLEELNKSYNTVICAVLSYNYKWNDIPDNSEGYIARYTSANFYRILSDKLKQLNSSIIQFYRPNVFNKEFSLISINSNLIRSNINDKLFAYLSGLGSYCKNSLISINNLGQRVVLGELFINIDITDNKNKNIFNKINSFCKKCNKCKLLCPTGAIKKSGIINRDICIQHLSSQLVWPEFVNKKSFYKLWGKRFFGCTVCIDVCPLNKNNFKPIDKNSDNLIGFIGTNFDLNKIIHFKKEDYKVFFKNNQISANWIPVLSLVRNCIVSLYNLNKMDIIADYLANIDNFEWDKNEKEFLKNIIFSLLNNKVK